MHKWIILVTILAIVFKWWSLDKTVQISDDVTFTTISKQQANQLFNQLKNLPYIEFNYANNYCEDRAHAMAKQLNYCLRKTLQEYAINTQITK